MSRLSDNASVLDVHCEVDASNASLLGDSETRRSLLSRKRELDDERKVQDQGLSLFVDYARTLNSAHTAPGDAVNFLDAFVAGRRSTVATIRKLDDEIAEIDQALTASDPNVKGEVNGRATLVIVVSEPCTAEVDIVYSEFIYVRHVAVVHDFCSIDVKNASWEPYYNLHATTANGQPTSTVSLQYNARVTHMSGEDWSDIEFNFVAADAPRRGHNTDIPSVTPRRLHRLPTPLVSAFPPSSQTSIWPNGGFQPFSGPDSGRGFLGFGGAQQGMTHNPPVAQIAGVSFGSAPPNQSSHGPSLFGSPVVPPAQPLFGQAGGGLFGSQASNPANSIQPSTTKAPSLFAPKPKIDNGKGSAVPDMCVTALGENIVIRESTSTHEVRLAAETKASVASDGVGHAVPITSLVLAASFTWVCVPRSRTAAFVECHTKNSSTHTLVAGPLTVYIDGQEVAKTTLPVRSLNTGRSVLTLCRTSNRTSHFSHRSGWTMPSALRFGALRARRRPPSDRSWSAFGRRRAQRATL